MEKNMEATSWGSGFSCFSVRFLTRVEGLGFKCPFGVI